MAVNRYRFYAGPLGALRALPPHLVDNPPEFALALPGASHTSLSGHSTFDSTGRIRRGWNLQWERIREDEETFLQSLLRGTANADLRFMDPRKRNLLPEDVSTGGSATRGTTAFARVGASSLVFTLGDLPDEFVGVLSGSLAWTGVVLAERLYGTFENTPILAGSTYRLSVWAKGTASLQLSALPFDVAGVEQPVVTGAVEPASGAWQQFSWEYVPTAGVASAQFGISAGSAGDIQTTAWMVQIDEALKPWTYGYGCPVVRVHPSANGGYWRAKYHRLSLQVLEV